MTDSNTPASDWSSKLLLLAEDETVNIRFIQLVLKKTGIRIVTATDGTEAVAQATQGTVPDLILMDLMMPGMDGFEAARAIRDQGVTAPIYALSGHAMVEPQKLREAGIDRILTKPIQGRELIAAMSGVLEA